MPKPFLKLSIVEFEELANFFSFDRKIDAIHMHHTWRPNHAQYSGLPTIEGMWRYHTQDNGWSDIAQHISIGPDGSVWTGRNWNQPPASAVGYNGNTRSGPFMFEIIGDFDTGKDVFGGAQKEAVIRVIITLLRKFDLPVSALRFHNHMTDNKSCPGTSIDYAAFCTEVRQALGAARSPTRKRSTPSWRVEEAGRVMAEALDVDLTAPEYHSDHLHMDETAYTSRAAMPAGDATVAAAHLINLRGGRLSSDGYVSSSEASLEALFQVHLPAALAVAKAEGHPLRLMFYAHGGLNPEESSVKAALSRVQWWRKNNVYPIFFIWETGLTETWSQMLERAVKDQWSKITGLFGRRGPGEWVADHVTDPAVERIARSIGGVGTWGGMKYAAEQASKPETGGAWLTAKLLKTFIKSAKGYPIELHAVGHSAGSIFHAHFLAMLRNMLGEAGPTIKTLHHLAPAIRVDLFKEKVVPLLGSGIDHLTMYTMYDEKERQDTCAKVYQKSLLYLIHYGLEPEPQCPLVGLEKSVRADSVLRDLFEPAENGAAEVIWSKTLGGPRYSSTSLTHGGFDDDPATMNSVCRRIVGKDAITEYNVDQRGLEEAFETESSEMDIAVGILTRHAMRQAGSAASSSAAAATILIPASGGARHALCIGIDAYPQPGDRLGGCVNDAKEWQSYLESTGFKTTSLHDAAADYFSITDSIRERVAKARAGDVIVIQFSGHGTQVEDTDGDETDLLDEALCCHDFRSGRLVIDDDLARLTDRLPDGVNLTFIIDSCHSGTVTRAINLGRIPEPTGAVRRFVPPSIALDEAHKAFRLTLPPVPKTTRSRQTLDNPYETARDILFAAALSSQFAYETGGSGVFTRTALQILGQSPGDLTHAAFIKAISDRFPADFKHLQTPALYSREANRTQRFLRAFR